MPPPRGLHHAIGIAANAKAAITQKIAIAVEHRQARQFDRHLAAIDRPIQLDPDPGLAACQRLLDPALRIERKILRDVAPWPPKAGGGARADQLGEFALAKHEAAVGVDLPDETQGVTQHVRRSRRALRRRWCFRRRYLDMRQVELQHALQVGLFRRCGLRGRGGGLGVVFRKGIEQGECGRRLAGRQERFWI